MNDPGEYPISIFDHGGMITKEMCAQRYEQMHEDILEIKQEVEKINGKMWRGLVMVIAQLCAVLTIFIKEFASR